MICGFIRFIDVWGVILYKINKIFYAAFFMKEIDKNNVVLMLDYRDGETEGLSYTPFLKSPDD